jgi:hypothetical protein
MLQVPVILAIDTPHQTTGDHDREPLCGGLENANKARVRAAPRLWPRVSARPASLTSRRRTVG